jgi:hypothetical protein
MLAHPDCRVALWPSRPVDSTSPRRHKTGQLVRLRHNNVKETTSSNLVEEGCVSVCSGVYWRPTLLMSDELHASSVRKDFAHHETSCLQSGSIIDCQRVMRSR